MSTVIPNQASEYENAPSIHPASKKVLKDSYKTVVAAIDSNQRIILITGGPKKGKTALLHTICKDISSDNRIISFAGKDLPSPNHPESSANNNELNDMKDFILESTDLDDKLIVTFDDAQCFPISFLCDLVEHAKKTTPGNHGLQLILTGPTKLKDQILSIEQISNEHLIHCAMDGLTENEILNYAKSKTYKISSDVKLFKFKPEALHELADFAQSDKQVLDVILEWCAAISKKDQLNTICVQTVNRAINYAQQFAKDKNIRLANSYPPSHEVYKFINQTYSKETSAKKRNKKITKKETKKTFTKASTKKTSDTLETKIPTISAIEPKRSKKPADTHIDESVLQTLHEIEDEIMPLQWTPPKNTPADSKNSFPVMAGVLSVLVLSFIAFIAYRIAADPTSSNVENDQVALNDQQENISIEKSQNNLPTITDESESELSAEEKIRPFDEETTVIPSPEVTENKIENADASETFIKKPIVAPLILGDLDQTILSEVETLNQNETSNSNSVDNRINDLLILAEQQFTNKRLTTPAEDNAFDTYQKVLSIQPDNTTALGGIQKIYDRYLSWANHYYKQNDIQRAKQFYTKVLAIKPNDSVALTNLQNIKNQEIETETSIIVISDSELLEETTPLGVIQSLLQDADENMLQIEEDISVNKRNYKIYQEAHSSYQKVLRLQPKNRHAIEKLSLLANHYTNWAEQQVQNKNYNIALFLYGQALSIQPGNDQLTQRIAYIRELKKSL